MKKIILIIFIKALFCDSSPSIALVLSGGGAKGIAHIPTLEIIDSLNIPIDYVIGTSMGAIGASYYALGYSPEEIKKIAFETDWDLIFSNTKRRKKLNFFQKSDYDKYQIEFTMKGLKPNIPIALSNGHQSFIYLNKLTRHNESISNFDDFVIPFRCNATDLLSGDEVIFNNGSLSKALRSSSSIPSVFNPIYDGEKLLVDGGVLNNLPTDIAKSLGAHIIIAVDASPNKKGKSNFNDIFDILTQSILLNGIKKKNENIKLTDILISPEMGMNETLNFDLESLSNIYNSGYVATHNNLNKLNTLGIKNSPFFKLSSINNEIIKINSIIIESESDISPNEIINSSLPLILRKDELIDIFIDLRQTNKFNNIHYKFSNNNDGYDMVIGIERNKKKIINEIIIEGNNKISQSYINNILDFQNGDYLSYEKLDEKILELYNLDLFESIHYELVNLNDNEYDIKFYVKESEFKRLKLGGSWSNYYKLIAKLKLDLIYKPLDKFRIQEELKIGNQLKENNLKLLYTGNYNFQFPIIPFVQFQNIDNNFDFYNDNEIEQQNININHKSMGLIIPIKHLGHIELDINNQKINYDQNSNENFNFYSTNINIDQINDLLYPTSGFLIDYYFENSKNNTYSITKLSFDYYYKIFDRSSIRLFGDNLNSNNLSSTYKNIHYFKHDRTLSFSEYNLYGNNISSYGVELNYLYKNSQTLRLIFNTIHDIEFPMNHTIQNEKINNIGVGLRVKSIFGPINFLWTKSDKGLFDNKEIENYYFSIGIDY